MPGAVLPTRGATQLLCPALRRLPITAEGAVTTCLWFPEFSWTSGMDWFWGFFACLLCCPLWCVVIVVPSPPQPLPELMNEKVNVVAWRTVIKWWQKTGFKVWYLLICLLMMANSLLTHWANPLKEFEWQYREFYRVDLDSDEFYLKTTTISISGLTCRKL